MTRELDQVDGDEVLDEELLVDFLEAVEAAAVPSQPALEEVVLLLERDRPSVVRALTRRRALRVFDAVRDEHPGWPIVEVAREVARRVKCKPETIRWWARN